jgi:hypothetical protein
MRCLSRIRRLGAQKRFIKWTFGLDWFTGKTINRNRVEASLFLLSLAL